MDLFTFKPFLENYLKRKFPQHKYNPSNGEMQINSVFVEDRKFKLYINLNKGLYHCFKSGESGNIIWLYAILENKPYKLAERELLIRSLTDNKSEDYVYLKQRLSLTEYTKLFIPLNANTILERELDSIEGYEVIR